jgi:hypothetical protein
MMDSCQHLDEMQDLKELVRKKAPHIIWTFYVHSQAHLEIWVRSYRLCFKLLLELFMSKTVHLGEYLAKVFGDMEEEQCSYTTKKHGVSLVQKCFTWYMNWNTHFSTWLTSWEANSQSPS